MSKCRGSSVVERKPEELSVVGSIPTPGTTSSPSGYAGRGHIFAYPRLQAWEATPGAASLRPSWLPSSPKSTRHRLRKVRLTFASATKLFVTRELTSKFRLTWHVHTGSIFLLHQLTNLLPKPLLISVCFFTMLSIY